MMNIRQLILAAALTLPLTSCGLTPDQVASIIDQVRSYAAQACSFRPDYEDVARLITEYYPAYAQYDAIVGVVGDAICQSPESRQAARRLASRPTRIVQTPSGIVVVVHGSAVRRR